MLSILLKKQAVLGNYWRIKIFNVENVYHWSAAKGIIYAIIYTGLITKWVMLRTIQQSCCAFLIHAAGCRARSRSDIRSSLADIDIDETRWRRKVP